MTDTNNSNVPRPQPDDSGSSSEDMWREFEKEHAQELQDVASSRSAKRFERHIKRQRKKALLSVDDLANGAFTDDVPSSGPRDFTHSSVLSSPDDEFVPPDPHHERPRASIAVFAVLFVAGILAIIASTVVSGLTNTLVLVAGVSAVIGGVGLINTRRPHAPGRRDGDDGARV
ncbi:hypothetical protein [uncultured Bifidobacterium sp.]|uniref:hypothetical protein n=1 Tax=uncultured Bifidobacterium sp. TaxID=165187 RepID=UPI00261C2B36|nr:hypothetical protein [uncultured Bifidobacterium sp.]